MRSTTYVIDYKEGEEGPRVHANMQALGGTVAAVRWDDALAELDKQIERLTCIFALGRDAYELRAGAASFDEWLQRIDEERASLPY